MAVKYFCDWCANEVGSERELATYRWTMASEPSSAGSSNRSEASRTCGICSRCLRRASIFNVDDSDIRQCIAPFRAAALAKGEADE